MFFLQEWCVFSRFQSKAFLQEMKNETKSFSLHYQHGWFLKSRNTSSLLFSENGLWLGWKPTRSHRKLFNIQLTVLICHLFNNGKTIFALFILKETTTKSNRCDYFCPLFLNERNKGTSFKHFLKQFSSPSQNEKIVKNYFLKLQWFYFQWKWTKQFTFGLNNHQFSSNILYHKSLLRTKPKNGPCNLEHLPLHPVDSWKQFTGYKLSKFDWFNWTPVLKSFLVKRKFNKSFHIRISFASS